ncbi:hypothetical protein GCM10027612_54930 [Microbispora bryophytorum subsp. camponoti]
MGQGVGTLVRFLLPAGESDEGTESGVRAVDRAFLLPHVAEEAAGALGAVTDGRVDHDGHRCRGAVQVVWARRSAEVDGVFDGGHVRTVGSRFSESDENSSVASGSWRMTS